jgi:hypothetical protein
VRTTRPPTCRARSSRRPAPPPRSILRACSRHLSRSRIRWAAKKAAGHHRSSPTRSHLAFQVPMPDSARRERGPSEAAVPREWPPPRPVPREPTPRTRTQCRAPGARCPMRAPTADRNRAKTRPCEKTSRTQAHNLGSWPTRLRSISFSSFR